jgi:hypothetical protein
MCGGVAHWTINLSSSCDRLLGDDGDDQRVRFLDFTFSLMQVTGASHQILKGLV